MLAEYTHAGPRHPSIARAVVDAFRQDADRRRLLEAATRELADQKAKPPKAKAKSKRSKPR